MSSLNLFLSICYVLLVLKIEGNFGMRKNKSKKVKRDYFLYIGV